MRQLLPLLLVLSATRAVLAGPLVPQPPLENHLTSHPELSSPSAPPHALSGSHCPLDSFSGPVEASLSPRPLLRPIRISLPLGPHLRCCPSFCIPVGPTSGPVRPSLSPQPLLGRPTAHPGLSITPASFGRCIPSSRPSASLVVIPDSAFLLLSAPPAGHSLLLEQHHVASRLGGCPLPARFPAAALPVARPGPTACAPSSWSALSPTLSLRSPRRLLRPGLAASRAAADAARSSGSAAPRGGGASLRQPERHTQWCALTSARRRSLVGLVPSRP